MPSLGRDWAGRAPGVPVLDVPVPDDPAPDDPVLVDALNGSAAERPALDGACLEAADVWPVGPSLAGVRVGADGGSVFARSGSERLAATREPNKGSASGRPDAGLPMPARSGSGRSNRSGRSSRSGRSKRSGRSSRPGRSKRSGRSSRSRCSSRSGCCCGRSGRSGRSACDPARSGRAPRSARSAWETGLRCVARSARSGRWLLSGRPVLSGRSVLSGRLALSGRAFSATGRSALGGTGAPFAPSATTCALSACLPLPWPAGTPDPFASAGSAIPGRSAIPDRSTIPGRSGPPDRSGTPDVRLPTARPRPRPAAASRSPA